MLSEPLDRNTQASSNISEVPTEGRHHHPVIRSKADVQFYPDKYSGKDKERCQSRHDKVDMKLLLLARLVILNTTAYSRILLEKKKICDVASVESAWC